MLFANLYVEKQTLYMDGSVRFASVSLFEWNEFHIYGSLFIRFTFGFEGNTERDIYVWTNIHLANRFYNYQEITFCINFAIKLFI